MKYWCQPQKMSDGQFYCFKMNSYQSEITIEVETTAKVEHKLKYLSNLEQINEMFTF